MKYPSLKEIVLTPLFLSFPSFNLNKEIILDRIILEGLERAGDSRCRVVLVGH